MYLHFSNFVLVFMIVGLVGEAVVIAEDFRPLIPPLFLSPDNIIQSIFHVELHIVVVKTTRVYLSNDGKPFFCYSTSLGPGISGFCL